MDKTNIDLGKIVMLDTSERSGVIKSDHTGRLFYFQVEDVNGIARVGEEVQFIRDKEGTVAIAKEIIVLADAARRARDSV